MKLDKKRTFFAGFAFLSICAFWQVYDGLVPQILKNSFNMNDAVSGVIMALDNILSLFLLPLFGTLSDKTKTKYGKRMPYIIFGTIASVILVFALPIAENMKNLVFFTTSLLLLLVSMSTYRSPAVALMPDITPKPLRSKANAIINLMGALGGIIMLVAVALLVPKTDFPDYMPVFAFTAFVMLVSIIILYRTTNEPKLNEIMLKESEEMGVTDGEEEADDSAKTKLGKEKKKSLIFMLLSVCFWYMGYNGVISAFSKYANVFWGLQGGSFAYTLIIAQAAAIISYIPVGMMETKIGRKKTILFGVILLALAFAGVSFFKTFNAFIFVFFMFAGAGWAAINVNSYPMVVDLSKGSDVGKYTGYYYTASQAAQILAPIVSGFVLEYGYKILGSVNPDAGYVFLFPYGAFFVMLSFVTMLFVKHGDSEIMK